MGRQPPLPLRRRAQLHARLRVVVLGRRRLQGRRRAALSLLPDDLLGKRLGAVEALADRLQRRGSSMPTRSIAAYHKCPSRDDVDSRPEAVDRFFAMTGRAKGCCAKGTGGAAVIWTGSSSSVSGTRSSFDATPHLSRRACL